MALVNEFFLELPRNNMFATIAQEVNIFILLHSQSFLGKFTVTWV